jgi:hypothetical protein
LRTTLNETATTGGDFPRHDLAVYEQALWSLENSPILSDGREDSPDALADDPEEDKRLALPEILSPEARRWITIGGVVLIGRG